MMRVSELIRAAIELLKGGHHIKGAYRLPTEDGTCYCMAGAIQNVRTYDGRLSPMTTVDKAFEELAATIMPTHKSSEPEGIVIYWNDHPERTTPQVMSLMARTARRLEAQGQ